MVKKICKICGKEFDAKGRALCCTPECSEINEKNNHKKAMKKYNQSEKGKAASKKYRQSDKGKATRKEYEQSERGKAVDKKYRQSEKGKAAKKKANKKYSQSPKGKATQKRYNNSPKGRTTKRKYNQKKIAELNEEYNGDLNLILKDCPHTWEEREAKMQVWFNESYCDGIIAKIESTPVCEVTGVKDDLRIHHLYSFNTHPELGNDPANMVRITEAVHKAFHKEYGYGNNTPEQWEEFLESL